MRAGSIRKRGAMLLAVTALATMMPTPAGAQASSQIAVGGIHSAVLSNFTAAFGARSGPLGENPAGGISLINVFAPGTEAQARVTCLDVVGIAAGIAGEVTRSTVPTIDPGEGVLLSVTDLGDPVNGVSPDTFFAQIGGPVEFVCPPQGPVLTGFQGNIVVQDA
jgi:hypothetical protein